MEAINELLEAAVANGVITKSDDPNLLRELGSIENELIRVRKYIEVNIAAIRKLLVRRRKNVPSPFYSVEEYTNMERIWTPESSEILAVVENIKQAVNGSESVVS